MSDAERKDHAAVRVFPPGVPLATIFLGVGLQRVLPITIGLPTPWRTWIGWIIVAVAILGIGLPAVILFRRSGQNENPWKPSPVIVERGMFRFSRNPMYLQMVLVCVGFAVVYANVWILALTPLCAWILQRYAILPEEKYLEAKFGEPYRAYRRRVRRWL